MASGAAGDSIFGNVFGGCISTDDMGIQRRPYHRNCTCALHKSRDKSNNNSNHHCSHSLPPKVSFPVRRSWSEGCLVAMTSATAASSPGSGSSPCCPSSPVPVVSGTARLPPHGPSRHH